MKAMSSNQESIEKICEASKVITSPFITENGDIYFASHDGNIYRFKDGTLLPVVEMNGQPNGLVIDSNLVAYVADMAHQSILSKKIEDKSDEVNYLVKDFEGEPLLGPHSIYLMKKNSSFIRRTNIYRLRSYWRYFSRI